jgi:hypothetical protein
MAFTVQQTNSNFAADSAISAGSDGAYFARTDGDLIVSGTISANSGSIVISNDANPGFSSITLRPGRSDPGVAVPSFVIVANSSEETPFLNITRTNMPRYPVETAVMLTAFPNNTTEFPSSVSVNGVITAKFQALIKTAGTDPAAIPRSNYTGYPIYIFNAPAANGYYDIVLNSVPSSGGVICVIYDNNTSGSFIQTVRLFASDGTTALGNANTGGTQQNQVIAGTYSSGQRQTVYGILSPIVNFNTIIIPAAEADALHAATEKARGFTK